MITLSLPGDGKRLFAMYNEIVVGPFGPAIPSYDVNYRLDYDFIRQGSSRYHENDVDHAETNGVLNALPIASVATSTPIVGSPERFFLRGQNLFSKKSEDVYSNLGIVPQGGQHYYTLGTVQRNVCVEQASNDAIEYYQIVANSATPTALIAVSYHKLTFVKLGTSQVTYFRKYFDGNSRTRRNKDFLKSLDAATIKSIVNEELSGRTLSQGNINLDLYEVTPQSINVTEARRVINSLIQNPPEVSKFNTTSLDYGDLAMEASAQANANSVNMIAFLKDLRRPWELIPKLKNLRKLKTHAGNYLGMEYGILPTIDDLKSIADAFTKRRPYIDRNGFSLYNAVHRSSGSTQGYTLELEQRIKIAIEDEDNDFVRLMNSVESSGFAPTLENIWDLVPYSFVLDWFVDVGGFLERIDSRLRLARLNIRYATMSNKTIMSYPIIPSSSFPFTGTLEVVNYHRWTSDQCPLPPLSLASEPKFTSHWLEASALIIQRKK